MLGSVALFLRLAARYLCCSSCSCSCCCVRCYSSVLLQSMRRHVSLVCCCNTFQVTSLYCQQVIKLYLTIRFATYCTVLYVLYVYHNPAYSTPLPQTPPQSYALPCLALLFPARIACRPASQHARTVEEHLRRQWRLGNP